MKPNIESIELLEEYDCLAIYTHFEYELLRMILPNVEDTSDLPDRVRDCMSRKLIEQICLTKYQAWDYAHSVRCGNEYLDKDLTLSDDYGRGPKERIVVEWPDSQNILGLLDEINGELIDDEVGLDMYGSCAYLVNRCKYERVFRSE